MELVKRLACANINCKIFSPIIFLRGVRWLSVLHGPTYDHQITHEPDDIRSHSRSVENTGHNPSDVLRMGSQRQDFGIPDWQRIRIRPGRIRRVADRASHRMSNINFVKTVSTAVHREGLTRVSRMKASALSPRSWPVPARSRLHSGTEFSSRCALPLIPSASRSFTESNGVERPTST